MLNSSRQDHLSSKCYFASSRLPGYIDHAQLPIRKRPFSTIRQQTFNHTLNLVLPTEKARGLQDLLELEDGTLRFASVFLKLSDLIEGDFFNTYIKTGNILMLSEGRPGIDHTFSLSEGVLRLEVDKATFERTGLEGKAITDEGRKHVKARYAIELNLRLPSMVRGKHGFERILWAFRNVLNQSLKWLFCDLKGASDGTGPISVHQPSVRSVEPSLENLQNVKVPAFPTDLAEDDVNETTELLEWLSLVIIRSPRTHQADNIDPAMSRYQMSSEAERGTGQTQPHVQDLARFEWRGLIHPTFIQNLLLAAIKACAESWFAFKVDGFDGKAYAFIQHGEYTMNWEYHG